MHQVHVPRRHKADQRQALAQAVALHLLDRVAVAAELAVLPRGGGGLLAHGRDLRELHRQPQRMGLARVQRQVDRKDLVAKVHRVKAAGQRQQQEDQEQQNPSTHGGPSFPAASPAACPQAAG